MAPLLRSVGEQYLDMLTAHPGDHEHLFDQADETERSGIAGQSA